MNDENRARKKRLKRNALTFQQVNPSHLLPYLQCLPTQQEQRLKCVQSNHGPILAADELREVLVNYDDWFDQLIPGLRELGHGQLADLLDDPPEGGGDVRSPQRLENGPPIRPASDSRTTSKQKSTKEAEARVHLPKAQPCHKRATFGPSATSSSPRYHLSSRYSELPCNVIQVLKCLDTPSPVFGKDWRGLADEFGFSVGDVTRLEGQHDNWTQDLLKEWSTRPDSTLGKLLQSILALDRQDIYQDLVQRLGLESEVRSFEELAVVTSSDATQDDEAMPGKKGDEMGRILDPAAEAQEDCQPEPARPVSDHKPASVDPQMSGLAMPGRETEEASWPEAEQSPGPEAVAPAQATDQQPPEDLAGGRGFHQGTESKTQAVGAGTSGDSVERSDGKDRIVSPNLSAMPVNNLNRIGSDGAVGPVIGRDVNCTGRTLQSRDCGSSSSVNPPYSGSEGGTFYGQYQSPDDVAGPLRTDASLDGSIELLMSGESVSTLPSVLTMAAGGAGVSTDDIGREGTATSGGAAETAAVTERPSPMPKAAPVTRMSSRGAPVQHPSERVRCLPEERLPSTDRTFSRDELMQATNLRCQSPLASGRQPYSRYSEAQPEISTRDWDAATQLPSFTSLSGESVADVSPPHAGSRVLTAQCNPADAQCPSSDAQTDAQCPSSDAQADAQCPSSDAQADAQCPSSDAQADAQWPSSDAQADAQCPSSDAQADAQCPSSDAQADAQSPLLPGQEDPGPSVDQAAAQPSAGDVTPQPQEPDAQPGSLAFAIPVMLSLVSALSGGDLLPNTSF